MVNEFARLLRETIETNGERYIAHLRVARRRPEIARFGPDDIDYGRGVFHVLECMTSIQESTLRNAERPLSDLDIETVAAQLKIGSAELLIAARAQRTPEDRIRDAAAVIGRYAPYDGAHHKQWCFDQALRAMLGPEGYIAWVKEQNADPEYSAWDEGIAP